MFGHQDDQHHHHDGDNTPMNDVMSAPAVDSVLSTEDHGGTTMHEDFNPALPVSSTPTEPVTTADTPVVENDGDDSLLAIKQQALSALSPLVGHLDQTPEEKFRTTMMLIQASDNHALLKDAFAAAEAIGDDKVKAQALLDVVNEINYFTQQQAAA